MWRLDKNWKGLRREVPWVDRLPSEMIRESVRLTAQPLDAPDDDPARLLRGARPARQRPHADVRHRLPAPPVRRPGARGARGPVRGRDGPLPRRQRARHLPAWRRCPMPVDRSSTATSTTSSPPAPCTRTCRSAGAPTTRPTATAVTAAFSYPKGAPRAARADAWPPSGLPPGADLGFLREQHLDPYDVRYGVLNCLTAACAPAEPRLRGGAVPRGQRVAGRGVAGEGAAAASGHRRPLRGRRTRRRGDRPGRRASRASCRCCCSSAPTSRWAAGAIGRSSRRPCATGCRSGIHFGGGRGRNPLTASGWPSFYIEDHTAMAQAFQAQVVSLVVEGVFEELPALRVVLIEGGFGWLPSLMWRMDKHWERLRRRGPAPHAAAVGVRPRALLGHHAADRGAARPARTCSPCSTTWAAPTGSCSPPTTRTGTSTTRAGRSA